jgi:UDP:flavonoid glycosyltransferase YjiC (YdhE family)
MAPHELRGNGMKITVNTFGTRGDIQPYIALSLGLRQAGHAVRIVTHHIFEPFVQAYGLDFYPLYLDPRQVLINQALSEFGNNTIRISRWMKEHFTSALRDIFEATLAASRDAELMLNSGLSFAGWHVAEKLDIPALAANLWPVTPSRYHPAATGKIPPAWLPFKGLVNYWSTKLANQLFFKFMLSLTNECRKEILDLRPMKAREYWPLDSARGSTPFIYGYSPAVVPKPPDWGDNQQITGYWFLDTEAGYRPETALLDFLADGPPPVSVGFGSMVEHEAEAINQLVIDALRETGQRGILLGGWSELGSGDLPGSIFRVDALPHDWLFPRVAAVVHHGGAGTTAAGLRAGVPGVVVPSFGDQFFWGWRVGELGAGPKPISRNRLTAAKLADAIQQAVGDEAIRRKAAQLGRQIRAEDGVGTAVRLIEAFARQGRF